MLNLLELNDKFELEVNNELHGIMQFKPLFALKYNKGKGDSDGRKRIRAHNELTYMYFYYSNAFFYYPDNERHIRALEQAKLGKDYTISKELENAMEFYEDYRNKSIRYRSLKAAKKGLEVVLGIVENITEHDVKSLKDIMDYIEKIDSLSEKVSNLEDKFKKEQVHQLQSVGNHEISEWEKEDF